MTTARTAKRTPHERGSARPDGHARIEVPVLGAVALPPRDQLVFFGGLAALAVVGILDWPVAAVVGVGHLLAARRNKRSLQEFGEALEQA
ncbi:MAG: hypothetical protein ACRDP6_12520 [Actinoallomurus sp.]